MKYAVIRISVIGAGVYCDAMFVKTSIHERTECSCSPQEVAWNEKAPGAGAQLAAGYVGWFWYANQAHATRTGGSYSTITFPSRELPEPTKRISPVSHSVKGFYD